MARIDRGNPTESDKFGDWPKDYWWAMLSMKASHCRTNMDWDCRLLIQFVEEAEAYYKDFDYKSPEEMLRQGYELDPEEVALAVAWLRHNKEDVPVGIAEAVRKGATIVGNKIVTTREDNRGKAKDNNCNVIQGNSADYLASRLKRDAPEVFKRLEAGEFRSVRSAAIEAGIVNPAKTTTVRCDDCHLAVKTLLKHYNAEELVIAIKSLVIESTSKSQ